jgi:hypothetical protein
MGDFLTAIGWTVGVLGLGTAALLGSASSSGQGPTFRDRILSSSALSPLLIIHYFLPYGLVIMALFMDLMSMLPQGSIGVAIGLLSIWINSLFKNTGYVSDLCEIPGLKSFSSSFMPQSLFFVSIVVTYLASFVTVSVNQPIYSPNTAVSSASPSTSSRIGASWGLAISVILIQLVGIMTTPECLTDSLTVGGFSMPPYVRPILSVAIGMIIGGVSGDVIGRQSWTQPSYNVAGMPTYPSSSTVSSKGPGFVRERFQLGAGLGEMPAPSQGGDAPVDMAKSSGAVTPGESSDQFVCEAYKNGQLVSSTLTG